MARAVRGGRFKRDASEKELLPTPTLYTVSGLPGYRFAKRAFDVAFSAAVVAVGLVPGALLSIAVAHDTGGSPIYLQERIGRGGRPFRIAKFRTMVADADDVAKYLSAEQLAEWERERKVEDDPRVTPLGRFLRRTSIDEFPNFLNVLAGQMSVVGPRPVVADELAHYGADAARLLSVRPGVTGWWQVEARNDAEYDGARQELELWYVDNASATLDARIVARTASAVLGGTGR